MLTQATQAAAFNMRKHSRKRRLIARLPHWTAGLNVNAGDFVQSNGLAFRAQDGGTTGSTAPNNSGGNVMSDGAVSWSHVEI
jgi:hypothetical protein